MDEAEANNLDMKAKDARLKRWVTCSLCEQEYHGVVMCALGWACWKTHVGRPETNWTRRNAITMLGTGLSEASYHEESLAVQEAELAMERRLGALEEDVLSVQGNIACAYEKLGRNEDALRLRRIVYSGQLKINGEEHGQTLLAVCNCAASFIRLKRFEQAKSLLRRQIPVARRVLGENEQTTLRMNWIYAHSLYIDDSATLDDLREAVTALEDLERTARRVFGGQHPLTMGLENNLRGARAALAARETTPSPPPSESV